MADKQDQGGKPDKQPKADRSPEALARAEKASRPRTKAAAAKAAPAEKKPREPEERVTPRLRTQFETDVRKKLTEQFGYTQPHAGAEDRRRSCSTWASARASTTARRSSRPPRRWRLIAGQKPVITKSRKSIATYKLRDGQAIGCKVTLRKARMYEFLDRLVNIALPRVRDFRGLNPKSFDGRGNYSLGIKEHIIFPEIDYDKAPDVWGMDITVCTTARRPTTKRARCWPHSTSRSGSEGRRPSNADSSGDTNGEEEFDREEQPASQDDEAVCRPPRAR